MAIRFTLEMEDLLINAERGKKDWRVVFVDQCKGSPEETTDHWQKSKTVEGVSDEQVSAILALAMGAGENDWEGYDSKKPYEVAEQVCGKLPNEIRPIP